MLVRVLLGTIKKVTATIYHIYQYYNVPKSFQIGWWAVLNLTVLRLHII